jgi:hypothetical protein
MKMATCHPDRKHRTKGLCVPCASAAYYAAHKEERAAYRLAHRLETRAKSKIYDAARREKRRAYALMRREENKRYLFAYRAEHWQQNKENGLALKIETFNAYGGAICACCRETLFEGLTIDHIGGGGAAHRKAVGKGGASMYLWLKKQNYPPGFQVLCGTCNMAKGTGDHCPHRGLPT